MVIHRTDDPLVPVAAGVDGWPDSGRAFRRPARRHHVPWFGNMGGITDEVEEHVTGARRSHELDPPTPSPIAWPRPRAMVKQASPSPNVPLWSVDYYAAAARSWRQRRPLWRLP